MAEKKVTPKKKTEVKKVDKVKDIVKKVSDKFAVIKTGGKQYIVKEGDKISIEKLPAQEKEKVEFKEVLMVASSGDVKVGKPFLEGIAVSGTVLEVKKDKKVVVFKMKAKKRYRKTQGHRQTKAKVLIEKI
jgi:large subunit ribosomal protein L21